MAGPPATSGERLPSNAPPTLSKKGAALSRSRPWPAMAHSWLRSAAAVVASSNFALFSLVLSAVVFEVVLVRWWLGAFSLAGHPGFPAPGQDPLIWLLGDGDAGMSHFIRLLAVAFAPYFIGLAVAGRARGQTAVAVAFAGSAIFGGTMLASFPAGALDIFHNIMDGRITWLYHFNPMLVPPSAAMNDPLLHYLHYWADTRAAYGPLWFLVTWPAYIAGGDSLVRNIVAYKALPFAFELIALVFVVLIMRRTDPRRTAAAVVCLGWNPLVLWEVAGNGHNDIVMMCFVLAAVYLLLTDAWPYAFLLLALSVSVKFISAVLLPIFVIWLLISHGRKAMLPLISGLAGAALLMIAVFSPFWVGPRTVQQLGTQPRLLIFSPASAIVGQFGEDIPNTPRVVAVRTVFTLTFAVLYGVALLRLRKNPNTFLRACVEVMFLFLVLMTWWFWPWYVVWGLALACLLPGTPHMRVFVIFSLTTMLIYISSPWRLQLWNFSSPYPMALGSALLVFLAPVLYAVVQMLGTPAEAAVRGPVPEA